jgi:hypothetical protein
MKDTRNKRTKVQVIEDRDFIARHYLRGIAHQRIADMLILELKRDYVLSRQQIEYDIAEIVKALELRYKQQIGVYLFEQLRKVDELESEAWAAWEASKKPRKKTTIVTKKNQVKVEPGEEPPKDPQDVIIESADQTGDVRYFEKIQWCIELRLRLLGFFRNTQYGKTLDGGQAHGDEEKGIVIYLPDNGRDK